MTENKFIDYKCLQMRSFLVRGVDSISEGAFTLCTNRVVIFMDGEVIFMDRVAIFMDCVLIFMARKIIFMDRKVIFMNCVVICRGGVVIFGKESSPTVISLQEVPS